jgi:hypothetical protein
MIEGLIALGRGVPIAGNILSIARRWQPDAAYLQAGHSPVYLRTREGLRDL